MSQEMTHFREHRYEIWQQLRKHLEDADNWNGDELRVQHGQFEVVLDVHANLAGLASQVVTRFRAPYFNKDDFRFQIKESDWSSEIACFLGAQDIEVGDTEFDDRFVLRANDEAEMKRLLKSSEIRREMIDTSFVRFEVLDDEGMFGKQIPDGVDVLFLEADGRITDIDALERLYELFADVLDRLCQIGSAYKDDPGVEL